MHIGMQTYLVEGYKRHCLQHHAERQLLSKLSTKGPCADQLCDRCQPAGIPEYFSSAFILCKHVYICGTHCAAVSMVSGANLPRNRVLKVVGEIGLVEVDGEVMARVFAPAVV